MNMGIGNIPLPLLIFIAIGALVLGGILIGAYTERKRREAIQRVANDMGLDFYQDGDPELIHQLSDLPLFSKGRSKRMNNMIRGETDQVVMGVFDYRYTVGSGKNSRTYRQTVAFFRSADLNLPVFEMRPQSFFHSIGKMFGLQDIDFESHPNFSKRFVLRGSKEKQVRATFHSALLTTLEQKQGICVEGRYQDLVFYRPAKRVSPEQIRQLMSEGFEILTLFQGKA